MFRDARRPTPKLWKRVFAGGCSCLPNTFWSADSGYAHVCSTHSRARDSNQRGQNGVFFMRHIPDREIRNRTGASDGLMRPAGVRGADRAASTNRRGVVCPGRGVRNGLRPLKCSGWSHGHPGGLTYLFRFPKHLVTNCVTAPQAGSNRLSPLSYFLF